MTHPLHSLLWPTSVAVVGASADQTKIRGRLLSFLRSSGYTGRILPINPSRKEINGLECFPSVEAIGSPIDVALVAIPAELVPAELERCAAAGVKNAVIITSGFAEEAGAESAEAQNNIAQLARRTGMRIVGPNAEGFFNAIAPLAATFSPAVEGAATEMACFGDRKVGIVAQSGGVGFALYSHGRRAGLSFSHVITSGNEADLTLSDFLDYLVEDEDTALVLLYLETIRDAAGFRAAAAKARARGKPILVIKVGQSGSGQRATASHTASVAGWQAAYDAAFAEYGVIQVFDLDEAMIVAGLLLTSGRPAGNRVGVVTVSGGAGAWAADTLERCGLALPIPSKVTREKIRKRLPSYGSAVNPIDVTAQGARNGGVQAAIAAMATSREVDSILLALSCSAEHVTLDVDSLAKVVAEAGLPAIVFSYTVISEAWRTGMIGARIPITGNLSAASAALAKLRVPPPSPSPSPAEAFNPPKISDNVITKLALSRDVLCEYEVKALLTTNGLKLPDEYLTASADDAVTAADKLGYPVVLKLQSPLVQHKTEIGGVKLNLANAGAVHAAYEALAAVAATHVPDGPVDGVLVQKMAPSGVEMIIGMVRDATFGPLMMVGFGGVAVELYRDVAYRLAPVTPGEARDMLDQLRSAPLLHGFRGRPKMDVESLSRLISEVSYLATVAPDIRELEINPVILHADGDGLTVADAMMTRSGMAKSLARPTA